MPAPHYISVCVNAEMRWFPPLMSRFAVAANKRSPHGCSQVLGAMYAYVRERKIHKTRASCVSRGANKGNKRQSLFAFAAHALVKVASRSPQRPRF
jgi:hypothetical protein